MSSNKISIGVKSGNTITFTGTAIEELGLGLGKPLDLLGATIVQINGFSKINSSAFGSLTLESVTISNTVKIIDAWAFDKTNFTSSSITIPKSVEYIGTQAFIGCKGLINLIFEAQSNIKEIGPLLTSVNFTKAGAFDSSSIKNVYIDIDTLTRLKVKYTTSNTLFNPLVTYSNGFNQPFFGINVRILDLLLPRAAIITEGTLDSTGTTIFFKGAGIQDILGNGVALVLKGATNVVISDIGVINKYAFSNLGNLKTITIPNGIIAIDSFAFYTAIYLKSITIPDSVTYIGDYAFYNMSSLTSSINIPINVTYIGNSAFTDSALPSISVNPDNLYYSSLDGVLFDKKQERLIQYPLGNKQSTYSIPSTVKTIAGRSIKSFNLTSITVAQGNQNFISVDGVLFDITRAILIQYPIGNIQSTYSIPNGVTKISNNAFESANKLTSIVIPTTVTTIDDYAFQAITGLTSITIPNSVTSFGLNLFSYVNSVKTIYISQNTITILSNKYGLKFAYGTNKNFLGITSGVNLIDSALPTTTATPTTKAPTTAAPTTQAPTTRAPTTAAPTTAPPTTRAPTTAAPTTAPPTTRAPTTAAPTTAAPTTRAPTTAAPTTRAPTTAVTTPNRKILIPVVLTILVGGISAGIFIGIKNK